MLARVEWRIRQPALLLPPKSVYRARLSRLTAAAFLLAGWLVYRHLLHPSLLENAPGFVAELVNLVQAAMILTLVVLSAFVLWRWRLDPTSSAGAAAELYALSPKEFERYVAALFRKKGYQVKMRGRSGDRGVDLELVRHDGRRAIVQCKRYRNSVGPDIVRELFGTMIHERAHHAFLVTTAEITTATRVWAKDKPITLIDGPALAGIDGALKR